MVALFLLFTSLLYPIMPTDNYRPLSNVRRALLLVPALLFVTGCAILTLNLQIVPKTDLIAIIAAVIYIQAANLTQPPPSTMSSKPTTNVIRPLAMTSGFSRANVRVFLLTSLLLSIVIPWIWLLAFNPTLEQRMLLGPHLFAMMTQVLFEIWSYRSSVSLLVRLTIPVGFVAYRVRLLLQWVQAAYHEFDTSNVSETFMFALALANLIFWGIILFYVLLLKVCPPYFASAPPHRYTHARSQS